MDYRPVLFTLFFALGAIFLAATFMRRLVTGKARYADFSADRSEKLAEYWVMQALLIVPLAILTWQTIFWAQRWP